MKFLLHKSCLRSDAYFVFAEQLFLTAFREAWHQRNPSSDSNPGIWQCTRSFLSTLTRRHSYLSLKADTELYTTDNSIYVVLHLTRRGWIHWFIQVTTDGRVSSRLFGSSQQFTGNFRCERELSQILIVHPARFIAEKATTNCPPLPSNNNCIDVIILWWYLV